MNFNNTLQVDTFENKINTLPYPLFSIGGSNICDTNGRLMLSCNGFILYDRNGYGIKGWEGVNSALGTKLQDYYSNDGFWNQ